MPRFASALALLALGSLLACPKPAPSVEPDQGTVIDGGAVDQGPDVTPDDGSAAADDGPPPPEEGGATTPGQCLSDADCDGGVCEGQGCGDDQPGTCAAADRMCTRDSRQYCGCDGQTFRSSGSCPGRRYASPGECSSSPPAP